MNAILKELLEEIKYSQIDGLQRDYIFLLFLYDVFREPRLADKAFGCN